MATLCDDTISVVLDSIHPPLFTDIFNQVLEEYTTHVQPTKNDIERIEEAYYDQYNNLWPATYHLNIAPHVLESRGIYMALGKLKEIKRVHGHTKLDYFNAIYQLLEIYKTHSMFHKTIKARLNYDYKSVLKILMGGFKESHKKKTSRLFSDINRLSDDTWGYSKNIMKYPSRCDNFIFTNSGCLNCYNKLPYWWPIAKYSDKWNVNMPHISKSVLDDWNEKTNGYISDGCCSFQCYVTTRPLTIRVYDTEEGCISYKRNNLKIGDKVDMICRFDECRRHINPIDAIITGTRFCSRSCYYDDSYEQFKYEARHDRGRRHRHD
jgi:hypothetical protein